MPATAERRRTLALQKKVVVDEGTGCHVWTGSVMTSTGYGQYRTQTTNLLAHRMAYELLVGPIPKGFHLHHVCENRRCVNVEHLAVVTPAEHLCAHRRFEVCPRCGGSEWRYGTRNGRPNGRHCVPCNRKASRDYQRTLRKNRQ